MRRRVRSGHDGGSGCGRALDNVTYSGDETELLPAPFLKSFDASNAGIFATLATICVCGSLRRVSAVDAPERTPTTPRRPALVPACRSNGVSPTAITSATLLTRADSIAWK